MTNSVRYHAHLSAIHYGGEPCDTCGELVVDRVPEDAHLAGLQAEAARQGMTLTWTHLSEPRRYHLTHGESIHPILGGAFSLDEVERYLRGAEI